MAPLDATLGALRLRIDDTAAHQLRTIRAVTGDRTLSAAIHRVIFDAYMALPSAHSVDAGELPPESPEGGPGQGDCTPPAPTTAVADALALVGLPAHKQPPALTAASDQHQARKAAGHIPPHVHLPGGPCVYGEACDQ